MFITLIIIANSYAITTSNNVYEKYNKKYLALDSSLSTITATNSCNDNNFTLTASLLTGANTGDKIVFYLDAALTQPINNGTIAGVTYNTSTSDGRNYVLTINGLSTVATYYAARLNSADAIQTLVANAPSITIAPKSFYDNNVLSSLQGCGSVDLGSAIQNQNLISSITEIDYFELGSTTELTSSLVTQPGTYTLKILSNTGCVYEKNVVVTILESANLQISNPQLLLAIGQTATINATSNNGATISYFNVTTNQSTGATVGPFNTAGNYVIRVDAKKGSCTTSEFVTIIVDNTSICKQTKERVYGNKVTNRSFLGIVSNASNAATTDPKTFATLSLPLGLLGLTSAAIDIEFSNPVPAGKTIVIKLGNEIGGLDLLSGGTITALTKNNLGNIVTTGTPQSVNANLLGLLNGTNEYEFLFTPTTPSSTQIYGVRVLITSAVSVAQSLKVFYAYYNSDTTSTVCNSNVIDVLSGVKGALQVASVTVGVDDPWNFTDGNDLTYTRMYGGVGVAVYSYLTPVYSSYSTKDDVVQIVFKKPNSVLSVNLINFLTYRKYDGNVPVSETTVANTSILGLTLLSGSTDIYVLTLRDNTTSASWNRFDLMFGGVLNLFNFLDIYSIKRIPEVEFTGIPTALDNTYTFCSGQVLTIEPQDCTEYKWYSTPTGTNSLLSSTNSFTIPVNASGTQKVYVQAIRNGCEVLDRAEITYTVGTSVPTNNLTATQTFNPPSHCAGNVTLTATIASQQLPALVNPYYQWYRVDGGNQVLIPGENTNTLNLTSLAAGQYTYYVGVGADNYCLTPQANRTKIDFLVPRLNTANDFSTSTSINDCNDLSVTITPSTSLTNVVYKWYFDAQGINEITNGTFNGITYTILANKLIVTNLANTQQNLTYYATLSSDQTCLNTKDLQKIDVIYTPSALLSTLVPGDQNFCINGNATLADIRLNYTDIDWYDAQTGGNILPLNTIIQNNITYYAVRKATATCANYLRLPVKVVLDIIPAPLVPTSQTFCSVLNAQVGDLLTNNYNVVWKNSNGVPLATIEYLVNGATYYAYNSVSQNCESQAPTIVTVTIDDNCNVNPDIEVTIVANNTEPNYLSEVTFTVTLKNLSPVNFIDVVTEVILNSGFQFKSFTASSGLYDRTDWVIPSLQANATETLTVTAKVLEFGSYEQRTKLLRSNPVDVNPTNNEDSVLINPVGVAGECLVAYNEISPNGDGYNDFFVVSCINDYRQTKLEIYNRYGNLVYRNNDYDNSFNGQANVSGTFSGNELPSGTYFYILQFVDGVTPNKSGWLYIMR